MYMITVIVLLLSGVDGRAIQDANAVSKHERLFAIHVFQVGQGDSQLIIFPSGFTVLNDVFESSWNSCKGAEAIADRIEQLTGRRHVDVAVISHWHLDHIGYAGYGGFWCLLERELLTIDKLVDRDGGVARAGAQPCDENTIEWHNVGTVGGTAVKWVCYFSDINSKAHAIREIAVNGSTTQIAPPDVGATITVVIANGAGVKMKNGETPVSGDHHQDNVPPSENDFSVGLHIQYGSFSYMTAGDLDGEYAVSQFGYTYNDAETVAANTDVMLKGVDVVHVNHHGSGHSSNVAYIAAAAPQASLVSCGYDNSHGHPAQSVLTRLLDASDVFFNNICALDRNYGHSIIVNNDIVVTSSDRGEHFKISGSNRLYTSKDSRIKLSDKTRHFTNSTAQI